MRESTIWERAPSWVHRESIRLWSRINKDEVITSRWRWPPESVPASLLAPLGKDRKGVERLVEAAHAAPSRGDNLEVVLNRQRPKDIA